MTLFWIISACTVFGVLLLACVIELNGLRNNFHGANGIFLFASGVVAVFSLPVVFIVTWIWGDIWTALKASLAGAAGYAAVYALVLRLFDRSGRASARSSGSR